MRQLQEIKALIPSVLDRGDVLLVVPPFGSTTSSLLGPHILQAFAAAHGYNVDILYLNNLLAAVIGVKDYEKIAFAPFYWMLGERLFARSAYC